MLNETAKRNGTKVGIPQSGTGPAAKGLPTSWTLPSSNWNWGSTRSA